MKKILAPLALLALVAAASADLATYTLRANASGILNGTTFTNAAVTLTGIGNTADIFLDSPDIYAIPVTATVAVAGVGADAFTVQMYVFSNQDSESGGFSDGATADLLTVDDAAFAAYDLSTSFGPVSGPVFVVPNNPYATALGDFRISAFSTGTFEANVQAVPEPASMLALGLGAAALLRRRKRG